MKDDKLVKILKRVLPIMSILTLFVFVMLINKKSYALFHKRIETDININITTADELPVTGGPVVDIVKATLGQDGGIIGVTSNNELTTDSSTPVREYRYSGLDVNNYIYFNCNEGTTVSTASESNCELWRIIGIFKDDNGVEHVKIVKNSILSGDMFSSTYRIQEKNLKLRYSTTDNIYRDGLTDEVLSYYISYEWQKTGIYFWLNTKEDETSEAPNKGYLSYLKGNTESMIEETKYYLGALKIGSSGEDAVSAYKHERAVNCTDGVGPAENDNQTSLEANETCRVWKGFRTTVQQKVSLLYLSDYGFSTDSSYWNGTVFDKYTKGAANTSWLQTTANHNTSEWLLSNTSDVHNNALNWQSNGYIYKLSMATGAYVTVRPTLYLKSEVNIKGGDGTADAPFFITLG